MSWALQEAFDELAADYDFVFTDSVIGRIERAAVWRWTAPLFDRGDRVLELGCGTGEDAVRLARCGVEVFGIDLSPAMIAKARERIAAEGLTERVELQALPIERLEELPECGFDGAISNFGPLNCVRELRPVASALAARIRPGGWLACCLMSRHCLWETLLRPLSAGLHRSMRLGSECREGWIPADSAAAASIPLFYHRLNEVRRAFAPWFRLRRAPGVGLFVPPTYLEPWAERRQRLIELLARLDREAAHLPALRGLAGHRLALLERSRLPPAGS